MPAGGEPSRDLEQAAAVFAEARGRLFGIAYRMLASRAEAEDIVQDTWVRWQTCDRTDVRNPDAFLALTTTRLCLNVMQSARARRETYVGPWLPEPVDTSADPLLGAQRAEALEFATLILLEKLTPTERAAYVLREAFDYPYAQIADIVQVSQDYARQLVSRARKHLAAQRREPASPAEHRRLLAAFVSAAQCGDMAALEAVLADDVVSYTDGNGIRGAARIPVVGGPAVARFLAAFAPRFWPGLTLSWRTVNGLPAVLLTRDQTRVALLTIGASAGAVDTLLWVMSPDKLAGLSAPAEPALG